MNWISIKDNLPKDMQDVLWLIIDDEGKNIICQGFVNISDEEDDDEDIFWISLPKIKVSFEDTDVILHGRIFQPMEYLSEITHWMPLPESPK